MRRFALALALIGCSEEPADSTDDSGNNMGPAPHTCPAVQSTSTCGDEGSILRGFVSLPDGYDGPTTGDLSVFLTHMRLGLTSEGGVYHISTVLPSVDLANGPVDFELDMCLGGEMWSNENCEFNLIAILDQNGNNGAGTVVALPDEGEPAALLTDVLVTCGTESPCHELVLDCEGPTCVQFEASTTCPCDTLSCGSDIVTCQ